jgi:hypothetical protein
MAHRRRSPARQWRSRTGFRSAHGIERPEVVALDLAGVGNPELRQTRRPVPACLDVRGPEGDMMDRTGPLPCRGQAGLHRDVQLGGWPSLAHAVDMDFALSIGRGVLADILHVEDASKDSVRRREVRNRYGDGAEATDLMLPWNRTPVPRVRFAHPPSSMRRKRWPSGSSNSIAARPSMVEIGAAVTPASIRCAAQKFRLISPETLSPVPLIEEVPRRSRSTGQSKKVRSVPGVASPSA